jgi:VanZ family protein
VIAEPSRLRWWRVAFLLGVGAQFVVLYAPRAPSAGTLPIDKVVHAAIFGGVLWLGSRARLPIGPLIAALLAHAVASELIQHYVLSGRSGDAADVAADLAGVLIVTLLLRWRERPSLPAG